MKIAILFPTFSRVPGGGFKVTYEYCNYLAANHDITIYYFYDKNFNIGLPRIVKKYLFKIYIRCKGPRNWFDLDPRVKTRAIENVKQIKSADILIATAVDSAAPVRSVPHEVKKFYFIQDFENWNRTDDDVIETYKYGLKNIVVSKWLKEMVDSVSEEKAILIQNGIDTSIFNDAHRVRKNHSVVLQYRDSEYKGGKYAIEVLERLKKKYDDLDVSIISNVSARPNLSFDYKWYVGVKPSVVAEINNMSQVFLCTSVEEGFGLPGLEAMACGCAVVSSSYKGVLEYAVDGENALLSPVRDVQSMVDNIVKLFEDEELRRKISDGGRKTGLEKSFMNSAKRLEKILTEGDN